MTLGRLLVQIGADDGGLRKALEDSEGRVQSFGRRLRGVGTGLTAGITVPLAAIGGAAFAAGRSVDSAMDTIRRGTGATGDALAELGADFEAVLNTVPATADQVATAIADINTRTGQTGQSLRDLATSMIELAEVSGEEVAPLIADTTRVFGDWGVATDKQAGTLDYLWKVAQSTGITIGDLSRQLVQYGAPLRQMGFSFEESAALMGKWEKEGVNAELVFGSLRIALGKGIDAQGLADVTAKIQELGPSTEATALAIETFGARAGADMSAAILEGRFAVDDLLAALRDSPETINSAAEETRDFAETFAILKNQVTTAIAPLGLELMEVLKDLGPTFGAVIGTVASLVGWFGDLPRPVQLVIAGALGLLAALGPIALGIGGIIAVLPTLTAGLIGLWAAITGPVGLVTAALIGAGIVWATFGDDIQRIVEETVRAVQDWFGDRLGGVFDSIKQKVEAVTGFFADMYDSVVGNSSVPDMVDGIRDEFARLDEVMVTPVEAATMEVTSLFDNMAARGRAKMNELREFLRMSREAGMVLDTVSVPSTGTTTGTAATAPPDDGGLVGEAFGMAADSAMYLASAFTPLGLVSMVLGDAMDTLEPVITQLREPLRIVGQVLAAMLIPVLKSTFPIFKLLGIAATYIGQVFFTVAGGIATAIGSLVYALGTAIDKIPFMSDMGLKAVGDRIKETGREYRQSASALGDAREDIKALEWDETSDAAKNAADSMNRLSSSITNMPEIFDMQRRKVDATRAVFGGTLDVVGGGTAGGGTSVAQQRASLHVSIHNPPANMDVQATVRQVTEMISNDLDRGGDTDLSLSIERIAARAR